MGSVIEWNGSERTRLKKNVAVRVEVEEGISVARPVLKTTISKPVVVAPVLKATQVKTQPVFVEPIVKLIEPAVIKLPFQSAPEKSRIVTTVEVLKQKEPPVGKFGNFLKKVGGALAGVASFVVPGIGSKLLSGVSTTLLKPTLTPKSDAPAGGSLTPKFETALPKTLSPIQESSKSLTSDQTKIGSVLGLPDTGKTNNIILIVGGVIALVLLLPLLLKRRR